MVALAKRLAKTYGYRSLSYRQVVLIIAHIVHVENSRDQKANRDAGRESLPGPARNLHVKGTPRHQESHRQVNQDITKPTRSELERLCAVEEGYRHTHYPKQDDCRATQKDQRQAKGGGDHKAAGTTCKHLSRRHFVTKDNRTGTQ